MVVVAAWHRSVSGSQGPVDSEPDDRRGRRFPCGPDTATSGYIFGKPLLVKIARFRSQKKQAIKDSAFRKNPLIFTVQHGQLLCPPCADRFPISVRLGGSRETGALTFEGLLTREKEGFVAKSRGDERYLHGSGRTPIVFGTRFADGDFVD